ncbi:CD82 antigen-like isoform X1 [Erpetoichthys calabaricus]|uniref:CD82 antigen-like isoform X1 n=1 Tax=Erpetoichthys calabaricus TaxID=27687 RepID=UPI002234B492|nr:CD82 antigen-like isoform X1 [Erpetoichthys calabaricus]
MKCRRGAVKMGVQGCLSVTKYILFLFNLLCFLIGVLMLACGLWILFDESSFLKTLNIPPLQLFSYIFCGCGTFTMMIGFFGCLGALKEVQCMLGMYFFFLLMLLAAQITLGTLIYTQRNTVKAYAAESVTKIIINYKSENASNPALHKDLDKIQENLQCCGWTSKNDWKQNTFINQGSVPCSCYNQSKPESHMKQNETELCEVESEYVYSQGCQDKILLWLENSLSWIFATCAVIGVIELFGMILSMCLCRRIGQDYDKLIRFS